MRGTELTWKMHSCFSKSLLEVVRLSFKPNFSNKRHSPREITKAFSARSWTNGYWAAVMCKAQCRAGNGSNISKFCEQLHYFAHDDPGAAGQNPMIEGSITVILCQQRFQQAFPLPTIYVQSRYLINLWYSDGSPGSTLLCRNLVLWKSSGSNFMVNIRLDPIHCISDHYLGTVLKLLYVLRHFIVSSFHL